MLQWDDLTAHDEAGRRFWGEVQEGRLLLQRCVPCGRFIHYPRAVCPHCLGQTFDWVTAAGGGEVYSYTVVRRAWDPDYSPPAPYVVALVDLDEGVRMLTRVVDCDPGEVRIGARVTLCFRRQTDQLQLPVFQLNRA